MIETRESGPLAEVGSDERVRRRMYDVRANQDWLVPVQRGHDLNGAGRSSRRFFDEEWGIHIDAGRVGHGQWLGDGGGGVAMAWAAMPAPNDITSSGPNEEGPVLESAAHLVHVVTALSDYRTGRVDVDGRPATIAAGWSLVHGRTMFDPSMFGREGRVEVGAAGEVDHFEWWTERPICVPGAARAVPARSTSIELDLLGRDDAGHPLSVSVAGRWSASGTIDASLVIGRGARTRS